MFGIDDIILGAALGGPSAIAGAANTLVNINQSRINRQFQRDMSGTAYQRAMADMRMAGLNPMLAYQQGGASTPSGSTASGAFQAPDVASALQYKLNREEQDNRNKLANANTKLLEAKATKEQTTVPAYEWGNKLLLELRPYADQVLDWAKGKLNDAKTGKLGDDLADWAAKHNLGKLDIPDPLKAETWNAVGSAITDAARGAVKQGISSAKQAAGNVIDNAKLQLKNSYLLKKHDTSPLRASDPALRGLPGVPKD